MDVIIIFPSCKSSIPDDLLNGQDLVLLNDITEVVVGYLSILMQVHYLKDLLQVVLSHTHAYLLHKFLELLEFHVLILVIIEEIEPVSQVLA
jgi:hypothetical protein